MMSLWLNDLVKILFFSYESLLNLHMRHKIINFEGETPLLCLSNMKLSKLFERVKFI